MKNRARCFFICLMLGVCSAAQYKQALPGYSYQFPRDHFSHPDYRTEWWYYTGNVKSADGHRFGFELTFFRQGASREPLRNVDWGVQDLYLAHFAFSDLDAQKFYYTERVNRAGPGIAGISQQDGRVWNGNWQTQWVDGAQQLQAIADDFSIRLMLRSNKPEVIHGRNGVSQKGAGAGHASHYISLTQLITTGTVEVGGKSYEVQGTSWMDHEFSTDSLAPGEVGWDWLSIQLIDNTELMLYRLRHKDGTADPYSSGTYIDAEGRTTFLGLQDFSMQASDEIWTSPKSAAHYPTALRVTIPSLALDLQIRTPMQSQELAGKTRLSPSYWEGAVDASGKRGSSPISGAGYLEMTGYDKPLDFSRSEGTP
jgi:predicted secreted hydrolase